MAGAERMEVVGRLLAAHDFNNLLTVISGTAIACADPSPGQPVAPGGGAAIRQSASRVRAHATAARLQPAPVFQVRPIAPARFPAGVFRLLTDILGDKITLTVTAPQDLPLITADAADRRHDRDACINACDAMPSGGTLKISLMRRAHRTAAACAAVAASRPLCPADGAYKVNGMDQATRDVFEPFFTTKVSGDGCGLGWRWVYGIVKQSHGCLAESELGKGVHVAVFPWWKRRCRRSFTDFTGR